MKIYNEEIWQHSDALATFFLNTAAHLNWILANRDRAIILTDALFHAQGRQIK